MSVEQIEETLLNLPREERRRFADWFYQHEDQILEPQDNDEIDQAMRAELEQRLKEIDARPDLLQPWDDTIKRVRQRLHESHHPDNTAR